MEEVLQLAECSICMTTFSDPRVLRCGHSYCLSCLTQLFAQTGRLYCPQCRIEQPIAKSVDRLPKNVDLRNVVEGLKMLNRQEMSTPAAYFATDNKNSRVLSMQQQSRVIKSRCQCEFCSLACQDSAALTMQHFEIKEHATGLKLISCDIVEIIQTVMAMNNLCDVTRKAAKGLHEKYPEYEWHVCIAPDSVLVSHEPHFWAQLGATSPAFCLFGYAHKVPEAIDKEYLLERVRDCANLTTFLAKHVAKEDGPNSSYNLTETAKTMFGADANFYCVRCIKNTASVNCSDAARAICQCTQGNCDYVMWRQ